VSCESIESHSNRLLGVDGIRRPRLNALFMATVWLFHYHEFGIGDEIVSRVEAFRASHGRLPESLKEVGMDDADPKVCYRRISDDEYIVWFGTTLGESECLNSRTKKWD
jgi:hypothetical protein